MLLVDTNVLLDVLEDDPEWARWSLRQLRAQSQVHELAINAVIYAELSLSFDEIEALDECVDHLRLSLLEIPRPALFLAARAYLGYRERRGPKMNVLSDFFIGAHASVLDCAIVTRDARRYRTYFPRVRLVTPQSTEE